MDYLDTHIVIERSLHFSAEEDLRSFYRASHALLNTFIKPNEEVQMHLLFINCVPILSYASAIKEHNSKLLLFTTATQL